MRSAASAALRAILGTALGAVLSVLALGIATLLVIPVGLVSRTQSLGSTWAPALVLGALVGGLVCGLRMTGTAAAVLGGAVYGVLDVVPGSIWLGEEFRVPGRQATFVHVVLPDLLHMGAIWLLVTACGALTGLLCVRAITWASERGWLPDGLA